MTDRRTCPRGCGADVRYILTEGGLRTPVDPTPSPDGTITLVTADGKTRGHILTGPELPALPGQTAYTDHDRTCPHGPDRKRREAALKPRCARCRGVMDPELARLENWIEHPCCDEQYVRDLAGWRRRRAA